MGIFDFFKKKSKLKEDPNANENVANGNMQSETEIKLQPDVKPTTEKEIAEPYEGDLDLTFKVYKLLAIPHEKRTELWESEFLQAIILASFRAGDPQVTVGPDGFKYFNLFLPEPNQPFNCFVIDHMKDDFLLADGLGVVINPRSNAADWVFTYGDILNLKLNKAFYTYDLDSLFQGAPEDEVLEEDSEALVGQPSEEYLPFYTRKLIADLLKQNGIEEPKMMLMMRKTSGGTGFKKELVFNLTPQQFPSEEIFRAVMRSISWYLPRGYTFSGASEATFGDAFMPF